MAGQGKIYTRRAIAQILDLTEKRVEQLVKEGVIAEYSRGHFKLLPAIQGYIGYLRSQLSGGADYNIEKAELTRLKREDAELDLQLKRNELHKAADVEFIMTNMLIAFKAKLDTLPHKVLPLILGIPEGEGKADSIIGILKAAVDEALDELTEYDPAMFDEESYLAGLDDTVAEVAESDGDGK